MKRFIQVPMWEPNAKFEITGEDLMTLRQFFAVYADPIHVIENIFAKGINSKQITFKYEDEEGNEVTEQEIEQWYKEFEQQEKEKPSN